MRLGDLDALKEDLKQYFSDGTLDTVSAKLAFNMILRKIDEAPTVDFEKLGESLRCQIRAEYGSCDDCELSCPRNELINLLNLERPQGEWKETGCETGALGITYRQKQCSNCGWEHALPMWLNFCPYCGAKMQKGGAE